MNKVHVGTLIFSLPVNRNKQFCLVLYSLCENSSNSPMRKGIHVFDVYLFYDKTEFPFVDHPQTELQVFS